MEAPIFRVQFIDKNGETEFTECTTSHNAIDVALRMHTRFLVQGIVNDETGDIYMTADQVRNEARIRGAAT